MTLAREDLKSQALEGQPRALVECLSLLKTDVARSPGHRPPLFAEFIAWGLFPALLNIEKAPPDTVQVDCVFWCQRLRLLPVHLAVQIILAGIKIPAESDETLHADIWPGVLHWMIFISRLDDHACQSLDPSVWKLVAAMARDLLEFLDRKPQLHVCRGDPGGAETLLSSLVRLIFCCPRELWSEHIFGILEGLYLSHQHALSPELASQIAGLAVIDISRLVEDGTEPDRVFNDRFLLLRLLITAEDRPFYLQLNEKRYACWLVAWMRCTAKAARHALSPQLIKAYVSRVDHILYCLKKLVSSVGIPTASEILASGFLGVTSSPRFQALVQWDDLNGRRDVNYDMIGLQNHVKQILESMQKFLVWQSFIRAIRHPIAAFVRSQTYKAHLHSQEVRMFLEIAAIRQRVRDDYIRRCSNKACDEHPRGRARMRYLCSRCKYALYCGPTCQRVDWRTGGHRRACTPTQGQTAAKCQDRGFLSSELVLPLLKEHAARLKQQISQVEGDYDVVLDFLDGGHGVLKFEDGQTQSYIKATVGHRRIVAKTVDGEGYGRANLLLSLLHMTADGELSWIDAAGAGSKVIQ